MLFILVHFFFGRFLFLVGFFATFAWLWPHIFFLLLILELIAFQRIILIFFLFSIIFFFQYALLQIVVEACQKKRHCKFLASSRTMNNDPCPETAKFIEIAYKCRPCKQITHIYHDPRIQFVLCSTFTSQFFLLSRSLACAYCI